MNRFPFAALIVAALAVPGAARASRVVVAASTNDLASIAASVGGDAVEVFAIARPNGDAHRVEVLPSYMVKVSRARLYLEVGLGLDRWADAVVAGSRNTRLTIVDCSRGVPVLEKPSGRVDASMGDVHPDGNPHYWLDPRNGAIVARTVAEALAGADPEHAADFLARAESFARDAEAAWERHRSRLGGLPVKTLLTYHASWVYFANAFGLEIAGTVEPKPGIPPTARHLDDLVHIARARKVPVLLQEPYFSAEAGRFLARETGLRIMAAAPSCGAPAAGSYLAHFDDLVNQLAGPGELLDSQTGGGKR